MEIMEKEPFWLGHRERLRLRAEEQGWDALKPHEAIELILYYAVPRQDMTEAARTLLGAFCSVGGVLNAPRRSLLAVPGVTGAMADWLQLTGELVRAYGAVDPEKMLRVFRFRDVEAFLAPRWRAVRPPETWVLYTDFEDRLITYTVLCDSMAWWEPEYVRQIVRESIALQARHALLAVFTGPLPPALEPEERERLLALSRTLRAADVELMDCVLAGESGIHSTSVEGGMDAVRQESENLFLHERYADAGDADDAPRTEP